MNPEEILAKLRKDLLEWRKAQSYVSHEEQTLVNFFDEKLDEVDADE